MRDRAGPAWHRFESAPVGLYRADEGGVVVDANPELARIFGFADAGEILGTRLADRLAPVSARQRARLVALGEPFRGKRFRARRRDGTEMWIEEQGAPVGPPGARYWEGGIVDATEAQNESEAARLARRALDALPLGVTVADTEGRILYTNPADATLHGYRVDELVGRVARELVPSQYSRPLRPEQIAALRAWKRERTNLRRDGTVFPAQLVSDVLRHPDGSAQGIVTVCEDVSERKRVEEELLRKAFYDELTGLPNRALFQDRLGRAWERRRRDPDRRFAILFLDLDGFKRINDALGHAGGDLVLVQTARRLEACIRPGDTAARLGGDEFVILVEPVADEHEAVLVAERVRTQVHREVTVQGRRAVAGASIGVAVTRPDHREPGALVRDADTAMYVAKSRGRGRSELFTPAPVGNVRASLDQDLRKALDRGELELHYQPVVRLADGAVAGVEALVRWRHPRHGLLVAEWFVPLAERLGLIDAIDRFVLATACQRVAGWRFPGAPTVSVNVSAHQFHQRDLARRVAAALADSGLEAERLRLELTESALIENLRDSARVIGDLRAAGVSVAIDDFGTGHASLAYLRHFDVSELKIDRSFVGQVELDEKNAAIVRAVIGLAHSLDIPVTAEGVETEEQVEFLRAVDCDLAQGFLLGRPAPDLPSADPSDPRPA